MEPIGAHFDGKVFVPDGPVSLDINESVKLIVVRNQDEKPDTPLRRLLKIAEQLPDVSDVPPDGAAEIDHYLYGLPKRYNL